MIRDILIMQGREIEDKLREFYVPREAKSPNFEDNLIKVVIGPRRAGKSSFCSNLLKDKKFGYVNFDDERLINIEDLDELIKNVDEVYDNPKILFFDEIQNIKNWELFVNRLQRQGRIILLTGSNSNLLSRELSTHLTGRHLQTTILPFSFSEYLGKKDDMTSYEIKKKLADYANYGGYPEPFIKEINYREYLSTLFDSIILKDIVERYKIRDVKSLEDISIYLLSNIANEYSYNSLKNTCGIKSSKTVENYIKHLEESFLFFSLNRFSYKVKEQLSPIKKIYSIDNGFIHTKAINFSRNLGKKYENLVAIKLKKEEIEGNLSVFYWKNAQQEEVDFVIKRGLKVEKLIQVCYNLEDSKTKEREIKSLLKAGKELKCKELIILNDDKEGIEDAEWFGIKGKIKFIPFWKWSLE